MHPDVHPATVASPIDPRFGRASSAGACASLLIASPVRFWCEGLAQSLAGDPRLRIVGIATEWAGIVEAIERLGPEIVLLDVAMPGSASTIRTLSERYPTLRLVALALADTEPEVIACAEAGISGYVSLDASLTELLEVIECVVRGEMICSPRIAATLLRRVRVLAAGRPRGAERAALTDREREIAMLLDAGLSNKAIAQRLSIRVATVKNHVHKILEKLQVSRRGEAAARLRAGSASGQPEWRAVERGFMPDLDRP